MLRRVVEAVTLGLVFLIASSWAEDARPPAVLENIAKAGVGAVLSLLLDAPASVEGVRLDLKRQMLELSGLHIGNPKGFAKGDAITAKSVYIEADPKSLFAEQPLVRIARVDGATVNAEIDLKHGINLKKLLDNVMRFDKGPKLFQQPPKKQWSIEKAILDGGVVNITTPLSGGHPMQKKLDRIETAIGGAGGKGLPSNEALAKILQLVMDKIGPLEGGGAEGVAGQVLNMLGK